MPSGWHHQVRCGTKIQYAFVNATRVTRGVGQVWNLEPTLSVNHNWISGASVESTGAFMLSEAAAVRAAIADCRIGDDAEFEWEWLCESVMRRNAGMGLGEWCVLLQVRPARRARPLVRSAGPRVPCCVIC